MKLGFVIDRKWDVDMINNSRARTADHEQLFVSVNQKKLDVFSALIASSWCGRPIGGCFI